MAKAKKQTEPVAEPETVREPDAIGMREFPVWDYSAPEGWPFQVGDRVEWHKMPGSTGIVTRFQRASFLDCKTDYVVEFGQYIAEEFTNKVWIRAKAEELQHA